MNQDFQLVTSVLNESNVTISNKVDK